MIAREVNEKSRGHDRKCDSREFPLESCFGTNELIFAVTSFSTTLVHNSKKRLLLGERSGLFRERKNRVSDF